ncbi:septum formation family protein [Streptomyces sp. BH097]|uniref:septum formation family protein n=1 Tax=unclassified Streptomyces TaxID=2593676 RepID=UPI003BB5801D
MRWGDLAAVWQTLIYTFATLVPPTAAWLRRRVRNRRDDDGTDPGSVRRVDRRAVVRGFALAGAGAGVAVVVLLLVPSLISASRGGQPENETPPGKWKMSSELRTGECFEAKGIRGAEYKGLPDPVRVVSCEVEHEAEVFWAGTTWPAAAPFPGDRKAKATFDEVCERKFETYVGIEYRRSVLDFLGYYPSKGTWTDGDRDVVCVAFHTKETLRGSVADSHM